MGEIRYTISGSGNNRQIQFTIPRSMRGHGRPHATRSGESTEYNICADTHFPDNPASQPDNPQRHLTGRWEYSWTHLGASDTPVSPEGTAQINQAGKYIFGWFQYDFPRPVATNPSILECLDAITGYFHGRIDGGQLTVGFDVPGPRPDLMRTGRLRIVSDTDIRISLNRAYTTVRGNNSVTVNALNFRKAPYRGANDPRLPDAMLEGLATRSPMIYLAQAHPLRSDQIDALHDLVQGPITNKIRTCLSEGNSIARMGLASNLMSFIHEIIQHRKFPLWQEGCQCRSASADRRLERCTCGIPYRPEQLPLVKSFLVAALSYRRVAIDGDQRSILELFYTIAEEASGHGSGGGELDQFRRLREELGPPTLPRHLNHYEYRCRVLYFEGVAPVSEGIGIGGRRIELHMSRFRRDGSRWVPDGDHNSATFRGTMGVVKVEESESAGLDLPFEGGEATFKFHTYQLWTWGNFPGYFDIWSAECQVKLPFGWLEYGLSDAAISFTGTGNIPPLIVAVEDSQGWNTNLKASIGAGVTFMFGWLSPGPSGVTHDDPDIPLVGRDVTATPRLASQRGFCFGFDAESLTAEGRAELGVYLAQYLAAFKSPHNSLRIEGHTSRAGSCFHNEVLSVRRSQFAAQAVIDILGPACQIPLTRTASQNGGSIRLFGYGEEQAAGLGVAEGTDEPIYRRVDIGLNGSIVVRLRVSDPPESA